MTVARSAAPRPAGGGREAARQILVVDDEAGVRRVTGRILREAGYVVHEAADGHEALELIGRDDVVVDAVVSDIVMPRLNGVSLLEELARVRPGLPVVLMSGYGTAELAEHGIASPCAVLGKPFRAERLLAEVSRCLAEAR